MYFVFAAERVGRRQTRISHEDGKCGAYDALRVFVMEVVNELGELEGATVPIPCVSGAGGKRGKSCQKVLDAKGAAELVSQ
jgi:hypothetical protein